MAGTRILAMGSSFVVAPILVAQLGPSSFGVWAAVLAAAGLFAVLGSGGDAVAARVIAEKKARGLDTRGPSAVAVALAGAEAVLLTAVLVALAPVVVAICGVAEPARPDAVSALRWIAGAYVFQRVTRAAVGCISGLGRHRARAIVDVAAPVLFAVAGVAVLLAGGGLIALSATYLVAAAAGAIGATLPLKGAPPGGAVDARETARTLWRLGRPRQVSQVALVVALLGERALIGQFGDEIAVGQYAAASSLVTAVVMVLLYAFNPLGPEFVTRATDAGRAAVQSSLRETQRAAALLAAGCLGALVACAGPLMTAWVGPELEAGQYVAILAPGFFAWLLARVGFHAAAAVDEPWIEARTAAWAVILNVTLALVVLELFGAPAAGVATSASLIVWAAAFARSSRAVLGRPSAHDVLAPAIVAAAIAAPLAIGGGLLLPPDDGSRWSQAALAVALALAFLGLYMAAMSRRHDSRGTQGQTSTALEIVK
jgi:O-antigen/teichoic acid export membrane protein